MKPLSIKLLAMLLAIFSSSTPLQAQQPVQRAKPASFTKDQVEKAAYWENIFKTAPGAGPVHSDWGRWEKYREQYAKAKQADQGAVVFLGDSITFHFDLAKAFPGLKTANRGLSGDTTRGMLYRLQEDVLDLHPKLIVLLCGVNDLSEAMAGHGGSTETLAGNVRLMLEKINEKQPKTPVLVCEIMPAGKRGLKEANEAVDKVVSDFPNAHRLKIHNLFLNLDGRQNKALFKDGTHPNEDGYAVWQTALQPEIKKHISAARRVRTEASAVTPLYASWHQKENDRIMADLKKRNGDVGLLLIGDSITALWPTKGPTSYSSFLAWKPLNVAISAEHTEHVLYRLLNGNIEGIKPKAAMVLIGTNNLGHEPNEKPEWVTAGVKKVMETVHEKSPGTKILLLALFPRGAEKKGPDGLFKNTKPTDSIRQRTVETNKLLAQLADNKKIFFMDIGALYVDADGSIKSDLMPDNLHPNEAGYKLWLDAVKPKLDELTK